MENQFLDFVKQGDIKAIQRLVQKGKLQGFDSSDFIENETKETSQDTSSFFDLQDNKGRTALHIAVQYGHQDIAVYLIENGHPIDPLDFGKNTPFLIAVSKNNYEMATLLLEYGASSDASNYLGLNSLHLAAKTKNINLLEMILYEGTNVNSLTTDGVFHFFLEHHYILLLRLNG